MACRVETTHGARVVAIAADHTVNRILVVDDHFDVALDTFRQTLSDGRLLAEGGCRISVDGASGMVVFAGHATVGERVAAIRGDVDFQQRLIQVQQMHGVIARLELLIFLRRETIVAQQNDAVMIVAQTELTLGGAHAVGDMAVGLARLDLEIAWQHGARQGHDDLLSGSHVRRAADDAARHLVAVFIDLVVLVSDVHMAPVDDLAVLLRFRRRIDHVADDDWTGDLGGMDLLLLKADLHQILGKLFVRKAFRNLDMVLEPINVNHWHGQSLPHHKLFAESHVAFHQVVHVVDVVA